MSIEETHKAIVRRMLDEVVAGGNLDLVDELVAPAFVNHNVVGHWGADQERGYRELQAGNQGFPFGVSRHRNQ